MSIATAITAAQGRVANAYTAISAKGGTLPVTQNLSNLPTAINSIPTSSSPTIQSLSITPSTSAQTFNASGVDGYKPVSVSAVTAAIDANIVAGNIKKDVTILGVTGTLEGGGGGYTELPPYQVTNGVVTRRSGALTGTEFSNITEIGSYGLYYAFYNCSGLTGALDLSALTSIGSNGMYYAFSSTGLTSIDLSALTSIGSYGMHYAFQNCTSLTSVDLSALTTIGPSGMTYAFQNITGLENVYFRALTKTSFGPYKNQFSNMLSGTGTTKTHTLHFPSNLESTISGLSGYPTFGGKSGYVTLAFDLPATS